MDVKQFVTETLTQILDGVADAQKAKPWQVAHYLHVKENVPEGMLKGSRPGVPFFLVDFDIAVTTAAEKDQKGGAKLQVVGIGGFGGDLSEKAQTATTSRIKFRFPLLSLKEEPFGHQSSQPQTSNRS
jgi:hypothetical protein